MGRYVPTIEIKQWVEIVKPDFKTVADIMRESVLENFRQGGRPFKWIRLQGGGGPRHLIQSGRLMRSIASSHDDYSATVEAGRGLGRYPFMHQFGGEIPVKDTMRRYFMARHMDIAAGREGGRPWSKWLAMATTTQTRFRIPASPFMMLQKQDIKKIGKAITTSMFKVIYPSQTKGKP